MKQLLLIFLILSVVSVLILVFGPRPEISSPVNFEALLIGSDVEDYLDSTESRVKQLDPTARKEIIWANPEKRDQTDLSLVYLHGFAGSKAELRPLPDNLADIFGANLFFSRLKGHGRNIEAMTEATMLDWMRDLAEAITIGERLGKRVVIMATTLGAALATYGMSDQHLARNIAAIVLVSPAFAVRGTSIGLLNMPWGEKILPIVMGDKSSFAQTPNLSGTTSSNRYPTKAIFPMGAVMKAISTIDVSEISTPALFIVSPNDKVIAVREARNVFREWGGPKKLIEISSPIKQQHLLTIGSGNRGKADQINDQVARWIATIK
ncbi:MAG: alpha/beta hydrolase [Rhizobiaceae bacterium]